MRAATSSRSRSVGEFANVYGFGSPMADRKRGLLELLRKHAPPAIVWSPFSTGWGASPFNPNCWRSAKNEPVLPEGMEVPELPEADA